MYLHKEDAIVPVSSDPPNPSKDYQTIKKKLEDLVKEAEKAFKDVSETQILKEEEGYSGITRALAALQVRFMLYIATIKREIQNNPNLSEDEKKVLFEMSNSVQRRITVDNFWTIAKDVAYKQFKPPAPSAEGNQAIETVSERALGIQTNDQANQGILRNLAFGLLRNQDLATLGTGAVLTGLGGVPPPQAAAISSAISPLLEPLLRSSANALATWLSSEGMPQGQKELLRGRQRMLQGILQALRNIRNIPEVYEPQTDAAYQADRHIIQDLSDMLGKISETRASSRELSENELKDLLQLFPIELSTFNQSNLSQYRQIVMGLDRPFSPAETEDLNKDVIEVRRVARAYQILKNKIGGDSPFPELTEMSNLSLLETSGRRDSAKFMVYQDEIPLDNTPSPMMFNEYGNNIMEYIPIDDQPKEEEKQPELQPEQPELQPEQPELQPDETFYESDPNPHPKCVQHQNTGHTRLCGFIGRPGVLGYSSQPMCVRPGDKCANTRAEWTGTLQPLPRTMEPSIKDDL
jgi:hypothetical protein